MDPHSAVGLRRPHRRLFWLVVALLLVPAAGAQGAPMAFIAELRLDLPLLGPRTISSGFLQPLVANATGVVSVSPGGAFALPAGLFSGSAVVGTSLAIDGVSVAAPERLTLAGNAAGAFGPAHVPPALGTGLVLAGGGFGGSLGLSGALIYDVLGIFTTGVPLSVVGVGGAAGAPGFPTLALVGSAWTTRGAQVIGAQTVITWFSFTPFGVTQSRVVPKTLTGFDNRTAAGVGTLQMVTPIRIGPVGLPDPTPGFGTLTVTFLPEPGISVLCVASALLLLAAARGPGQRNS